MKVYIKTFQSYAKLVILTMSASLLIFDAVISGHVYAESCVEGWSNLDCQALINDWVDWVPDNCGQAIVDFGKLDGMTIPDDHGKFAPLPAIDSTGTFEHDILGTQVAFHNLAATLEQPYRDYYIAMRWDYSWWNWDGSHSTVDPKQEASMQSKPRMVLVTDTRTGKSVVVTALEAGPAPWMGVDSQPNNIPKEGWVNPQPSGGLAYTGDVAGLSPAAVTALGDPSDPKIGEARPGDVDASGNSIGDELKFSWADQGTKPGSFTVNQPSDSTETCTQATGPGNVVFISQRDPRWLGHDICWGSSQAGQCASIYSEGCWATSVAMIISTLGNRGFVTPMQTEGDGQPPASFANSNLNEQWFDRVNSDSINTMLEAVRGGALVLIHGSGAGPDGGPFYNTPTHWEVVRGVSGDGTSILVDDPWDLPDPNNNSQPAPGGHTLKTWPLWRDVVPTTLGFGIITKRQP